MSSILIVEDEERIASFVDKGLRSSGFATAVAGDGESGLAMATSGRFDLVVLDLGLPDIDGIEVLRRMRGRGMTAPVVILTARDGVHSTVEGLEGGADDYVTKPFSARELLARVRALGRRAPVGESLDEVQADGAVIDLARMTVVRGESRVALTPREVGIVRWLYRNQDRVVSRAELLEQVFGQRGDLQTRAVDMAIAVLRKKLEADPARPTLIVSVKGAGYAWRLAR